MVCRKMEKGQEKRERLARQKYGLRIKGFILVMEEVKQVMSAKTTKVKQNNSRIKQFQDNRNFQTNQGRFFKSLEGKVKRAKPPNVEDATAFWKGIWSIKGEHKGDTEWIDKTKQKITSEKQNIVKITEDDIKRKLRSMPD